jgi:hypothetical protein
MPAMDESTLLEIIKILILELIPLSLTAKRKQI